MKNPFERSSHKVEDEYEPDEEVLELLIAEARQALAKQDKNVDDADIRGGVIRAMRAAEKAGDPFTKESAIAGDAALDEKLVKATDIESGMKAPGYRIADANRTVIGQAPSQAELERIARENRESYER